MSTSQVNIVNVILMLLSLALAYILPFHVFVLSYAILGPLHYLTQIPWMHRRQYFIQNEKLWRWVAGFMVLSTILLMFSFGYIHIAIPFCVAIGAVLSQGFKSFVFWIVASLFILMCMLSLNVQIAAWIGLFLPTLIHVSLFTLLFILFGSLKSNDTWGYISCVVYVICVSLCFMLEPEYSAQVPDYVTVGQENFSKIISEIQNILGWSQASLSKVMFVLSFVYTYHYLNWFSKVNILKWNQVSNKTWVFIISIYIIALSVYFCDFYLGLKFMLFLSILHVLLEFPLNVFVIKSLVKHPWFRKSAS